MVMNFDDVTGSYEITLTADAAHPFVGTFRININLFNPDAATVFKDVSNDFSLTSPTTTMTLSGSDLALTTWQVGQRVFTNSLAGTPNPPGTSLFRSSVNNFPLSFLTNEDVIAFQDLALPAIIELNVVPVDIDIKPGSDPSSINCDNVKGVIPVAILTTDQFDATTVDHTTVSFEGATETHVNKKTGVPRRHEEDVDDDGDIDLVLHFRLADTRLTCSSTEGTLTGEAFDGTPIEGTDATRMIPFDPPITNFPATFAPNPAAVGDTVVVTAGAGFLFSPAATATFPGGNVDVVGLAADGTTMSVVLQPDVADVTGPLTVTGVIASAAPQLPLTLPTATDVTQTKENFAGTDNPATAPVITIPSSGNTLVILDGGPFDGDTFAGNDSRYYAFTLTALTTFDFTGTWTSDADLGFYFLDNPITSIFGAVDALGGGPSGQPETGTVTLNPGTYILAVVRFDPDPAAYNMVITTQ
jgi:hypothetical protein